MRTSTAPRGLRKTQPSGYRFRIGFSGLTEARGPAKEKKCARTAQLEGIACIFLTVRMLGWNFGLILPICRNMVFVSDIHVLAAAFFMGLASAAPMGPVNMLAIRRGMIGGWRRTLACAIGSVAGDLILFSLVLLGFATFCAIVLSRYFLR